MTAILTTLFLSLAPAKAAILKYEVAYWQRKHTPSTTVVARCKRRSDTRIKCEVETTITMKNEHVIITTTPEAIALRHGIIKIHPGTYGFIDTERTLAE